MGIISAPNPEILPRQDRADGVVGQIGNTPLLRLADLPRLYGINPRVELYAKAEWFNPSGSVKDRAALYMIRDGEERE